MTMQNQIQHITTVKDRAKLKLERDAREILCALQDPETVEIMVNADGRIWQEKLGQRIEYIGNLQAAQAEAVIKTVAGFHGKEVTRSNPIIEGEFVTGGQYRFISPQGENVLSGKIHEAVPLKRLDFDFTPVWFGPDLKTSRAVFEIESDGEHCTLTILHFSVPAGQDSLQDGWTRIMGNLKALLETGAVPDQNAA